MAEETKPKMAAKEMIAKNAEAKTKVKFSERMALEIIADTKHFKKGDKIKPHVVMAKQLIKDKIAKAV